MKTCYNGAGREVSVTGSTDNFVSSVAYAGAGVYGSDGGMTGLDVGAMTNKIKVTMEYNDHHRQLKALQAMVGGVLQWRVENRYCASGADGCAGNNGNIQQMLLNDGSVVRTQNFGYDEMNRLTVAVEAPAGTGLTGYQQNFGYTRNGNRWVAAGSTRPGGAYTANGESWYVAATNRYSTVDGWFGYDGGGNLVKEGIYGYTWDGENRMVQSTMDTGTAGTVTTGYVYDGDGRRVKRGGTVFVYDAFGKLAAEYGGTGPGNCRVCYMVSDHLGSVRVVFNESGAVVKRSDYMPFGEEILSGVDWGNGRGTVYNPEPAGVRQKFTGKERDAETGLDWMKTRYFSGAQGRFTSPDKPFADQFPEDPQSWNLYTYVRNNPLKMVDEDGQSATLVGAIGGGIIGGAVAAWRGESVWKGAASGAIAGAVAGSVIDTGGASLGVLALSGAAGGLTGGIVSRGLNGEGTTLQQAAVDAAVGGTVGVVLGAGGKAVSAALSKSAPAVAEASNLTASEIQAGIKNAPLKTGQDAISAPAVNRYVDKIRGGQTAPPIKVDGNVIVDGNHRYAAGVLTGKPPATTPGTASPSQVRNAKPFGEIKVDPKDWGNH